MYLRLDNIVFTVENQKFHHGTNAGDISCFMSSCFLLPRKVWFFFYHTLGTWRGSSLSFSCGLKYTPVNEKDGWAVADPDRQEGAGGSPRPWGSKTKGGLPWIHHWWVRSSLPARCPFGGVTSQLLCENFPRASDPVGYTLAFSCESILGELPGRLTKKISNGSRIQIFK